MPLSAYLTEMTTVLDAIPSKPEDINSGTQLIKTFADIISTKLGDKTPGQLGADHATDIVFEDGKEPSAKTIKRAWWSSYTSSWLFRVLFPLGPTSYVTPDYFQRTNQGILCQPSSKTGFSPIEHVANQASRAFCRTGKMGDADDFMEFLVDIFTNTQPVDDDDIDSLSVVFVTGKAMTEIYANRIDLVHAIRLLFFTGYLIYWCNPTAFKWAHPVFLITAVFQAQANFFPPDKDMDTPLSEAQKSNYLFALGINVCEAIRQPFDARFFNSADLFPATINPTSMPQPLALGYVPPPPPGAPPGAPPAAANQQTTDEFSPAYFLYGNQVAEGTTDADIPAELFDQDTLFNYNAVRNQNGDLQAQLEARELKILMTIICPKSALNTKARKNHGCKNKAAMIATLRDHIGTFGTTHQAYLQDLEATEPDA